MELSKKQILRKIKSLQKDFLEPRINDLEQKFNRSVEQDKELIAKGEKTENSLCSFTYSDLLENRLCEALV